MFAMRKVLIALAGSIVVLVSIVLLAQEQVIRPGIARTEPVVVYKAAHGLTSASVGKPLVENNDGTWSVVNDAAASPHVDGILTQVISADHFRLAMGHSLVQVPVALLDGGASYSIATSGRMLYWDNSAGIYKAANQADSNLGSATCQIISSLGATNVVVHALNPMEKGGTGGGSPGGSNLQVQYNNAGAFGGAAGWVVSGSSIQAAIDALPATGGTVFVPAGTYTVTSPIILNKAGTRVVGAGRATIVKPTAAAVTAFRISEAHCLLENFHIDSDSLAANGVILHNAQNSIVRKLFIGEMTGAGIKFDTAATTPTGNNNSVHVVDCWVTQCQYGYDIPVKQLDNNALLFHNCRATNNTADGFRLKGQGIVLQACLSENNTGYGVRLGDSADATDTIECIIDCWMENNTAGGAIGNGKSQRNRIDSVTTQTVTNSGASQDYRILRGNRSFVVRDLASGFESSLAQTARFGTSSVQSFTIPLCSSMTAVNNTIAGSGSGAALIGGDNNIAFGFLALDAATSANNAVAIGSGALGELTTGTDNTAIGRGALGQVTTAAFNTGIGAFALQICTGAQNTAIGRTSMVAATSADNNTAVGISAGDGLTTGDNNVFVGWNAGNNLTTGSNNIVIGYDIDAPVVTGSNQMTIGNLIFATGVDGTGTTISTGKVGIATSSPTGLLSLGGNAARTFQMERHTTADTAGNNLTVKAGGATSAATNKAGGDLLLEAGQATGNAISSIRSRAVAAGASGTADGTYITKHEYVGRVATTDATDTVIYTFPLGSWLSQVAYVRAKVIGRVQGTGLGDSACYQFDVKVEVGANDGTSSINTPQNNTTMEDNTVWDAKWVWTDGTPDSLTLKVTGVAATNIDWNCWIELLPSGI